MSGKKRKRKARKRNRIARPIPKPISRSRWGIFGGFKPLMIVLSIWVLLVLAWAVPSIQVYRRVSVNFDFQSMTVLFFGPRYLSANEKQEFSWDIYNRNNFQVHATGRLMADGPVQIVSDKGNNVLYDGFIPGGESRHSEGTLFTAWENATLGTDAGLAILVTVTKNLPELRTNTRSRNLGIGIGSIPWARSMSHWLFGLAGVLTLFLMGQIYAFFIVSKKKS